MAEGKVRRLLKEVDEVYASRGRQIVHIDMRDEKPDWETLKGLLMGPTGNLRAPAARIGRVLVVGFSRDVYEEAVRPS